MGAYFLKMKKNKLTQKEIRRLFSYNKNTGILKWKVSLNSSIKIGSIAGTKHQGYLDVKIYGKSYRVHRIIWLGIHGYFTENEIDHINKNGIDNRLCNLREVSRQCNVRNRGINKRNKSGITGVYYHRKKWESKITINYKQKNIGTFTCFDEAVCHRLAAEQCLDWNKCDFNSPAYKYVKENIQNV